MKMVTCTLAQDKVTHHRLRVSSNNPSSKAAAIFARGAYAEYVSTEKWRPACAKPLRRRQGTPLAAFFNKPGDVRITKGGEGLYGRQEE